MVVSYCRTDLYALTYYPNLRYIDIAGMEVIMFLTTKINFMSGMIIGAAAVMIMKQMCKRKRYKKHQETNAPVAKSD